MSTLLGAGPLTDFGRDSCSSDSLQSSRIFLGEVNNARFHRFPVGKILRHLNITTSIGEAVKTFEQNFSNVTIRGRFPKNAKIPDLMRSTCLAIV